MFTSHIIAEIKSADFDLDCNLPRMHGSRAQNFNKRPDNDFRKIRTDT